MKKVFVNIALLFTIIAGSCFAIFFINEINAVFSTGVPEAYPGYMRMWSLFTALAIISIILSIIALVFFNKKKK